MEEKKPIRSFQDLEVYQSSYECSLIIIGDLLPKLPKEEKFDLVDQLRRSTKAVPRLVAEGFAKKHQSRGFQKYLDDAMAETNETIVGLSQCRDIYGIFVDKKQCDSLIDRYDMIGRQLFRLTLAWDRFTNSRLKPPDETGRS